MKASIHCFHNDHIHTKVQMSMELYVLFCNFLWIYDYFQIESLEIEQKQKQKLRCLKECTILK